MLVSDSVSVSSNILSPVLNLDKLAVATTRVFLN